MLSSWSADVDDLSRFVSKRISLLVPPRSFLCHSGCTSADDPEREISIRLFDELEENDSQRNYHPELCKLDTKASIDLDRLPSLIDPLHTTDWTPNLTIHKLWNPRKDQNHEYILTSLKHALHNKLLLT